MSAIFSFSNFCATIGRMGKGLGQIHACRLNFRVSFCLPAHMEDETAALESVEAEEEWAEDLATPLYLHVFSVHDYTTGPIWRGRGCRRAMGSGPQLAASHKIIETLAIATTGRARRPQQL